MTLRITLISPEYEDFILEFKTDTDASFANLHQLILRHCGYEELPGQRFLICDDSWKPIQRILLDDEENNSIDEDIYLMAETRLGEFLEDEKQRFIYVFEPGERRKFLLELTEITFSDPVPQTGILTRHHGNPPAQFFIEEEPAEVPPTVQTEEPEEKFYGEDGFEEEDLDLEGFDILE